MRELQGSPFLAGKGSPTRCKRLREVPTESQPDHDGPAWCTSADYSSGSQPSSFQKAPGAGRHLLSYPPRGQHSSQIVPQDAKGGNEDPVAARRLARGACALENFHSYCDRSNARYICHFSCMKSASDSAPGLHLL